MILGLLACLGIEACVLELFLSFQEAAPDEKYNMSISASECAIIITSTSEPKCTVKVVLTSPAMREGEDGKTVENGVKSEGIFIFCTHAHTELDHCMEIKITFC